MNKLYEAIRFAYLITIEEHSSLRYFFSNALYYYRYGDNDATYSVNSVTDWQWQDNE